ncbi:MAG: NfeD family protein [Clostridiales bacterium]|nr:NfeD family protein [Clostridiales bacterium]
MHTLFTICFVVGSGYVVISFLLGEIIDVLDFDFSFDFLGGVFPLKPSVIAAFVTVFGGAGLIFSSIVGNLLALAFAAILGIIVAFLLYRFVIVPLYRAQNTSAADIQSFIGMDAKVTERIPQGSYGKIRYFANGNTYSAPAKSEDGGEIGRHEDVVIVYIEKNTYFVKKKAGRRSEALN